ncbi:MAG: transposase IS1595 [Mycoplasmataceae bacterium RV_VA103A]|nr:MAG: transposase IS1595 [Mycoplasmataceae bacterium RV_VA103A]KLL04579.1 MAG: transposase IS1595 [Mycoplasmataceae bacterium RV_VA103A]
MTLEFKSLSDLLEVFPTEQSRINYFEERRWKGKIVSPFDPTSKIYKCAKNRYWCKNTNKYFTVRNNSIFGGSRISFKNWFLSIYFLATTKKSISTPQLAKFLGVTQKTAWFILSRLREALSHPNFAKEIEMLGGVSVEVEIDETFSGGKNGNRHWDKKVPHSQGRSYKDKTPVLVMMERQGNVITQVVPDTKRKTLEPIIKEHVKGRSNVYTDEWHAYKNLEKKGYKHEIVNHRIKQYVSGKVHVNSVENFNSHFKRNIYGIHHKVSKKHIQKYANESAMRHNTRNYSVKEKFDFILDSTVGKRLTYKNLIKKDK